MCREGRAPSDADVCEVATNDAARLHNGLKGRSAGKGLWSHCVCVCLCVCVCVCVKESGAGGHLSEHDNVLAAAEDGLAADLVSRLLQ